MIPHVPSLLLILLVTGACGGDEAARGSTKTPAIDRAARRAYDGAPPVIPHDDFGAASCTSCHNERGIEVAEVGFAPPMPHEQTPGLSASSRCRQCHVFRVTDGEFRGSTFVGEPQTVRGGDRMYDTAPPRMPHAVFMRENCVVCHSGTAAREEIRCSHPERANCRQCHVPVATEGVFTR